MHRFTRALVSVALVASGAGAQQTSMPTQNLSTAQPSVLALRIGDVLRVAVWREPTLSGDFAVDQDGIITLPMLGARKADQVPWTTLRDSIMAGYKRELRTTTITLTPLRRVYVLGSVLRPGMYMLDPTFGLEGAVSLAGGAGPDGNLDRIRVTRDGNVFPERIPVKTTSDKYDVRSGDQLFIERRSWLDRNSTLLLTSVISLAGLAVTLAARR